MTTTRRPESVYFYTTLFMQEAFVGENNGTPSQPGSVIKLRGGAS